MFFTVDEFGVLSDTTVGALEQLYGRKLQLEYHHFSFPSISTTAPVQLHISTTAPGNSTSALDSVNSDEALTPRRHIPWRTANQPDLFTWFYDRKTVL